MLIDLMSMATSSCHAHAHHVGLSSFDVSFMGPVHFNFCISPKYVYNTGFVNKPSLYILQVQVACNTAYVHPACC